MSVSALLVLLGLVLLVGGGELLVRGSSGLARSLGLSPLVIGLTVVAFATSAPEFAVTLGATLGGEPDLAVGNVVGSNIVNVLLILGVSALVIPLAVASRVVRRDVPVMVGLSVAALLLALDGRVSPSDGVVLLGVLVVYTVASVVGARRETADQRAAERESAAPRSPVWRDVAVALGGVVLLVAGARALVTGATDIAVALQVSSAVIGLTVVAIGTSLPELATSVVAAVRGERDIAIGNIVGSNIFNLAAVLGLSAVLSAGGVPVAASIIAVDLPLMVAAALALLPVAVTGFRMARAEGGLFVLLYAAYTAYLVLDSAGHDALDGFTTVMLWFVLPLVAATLLATLAFEVRQRQRRRQPAAPHSGLDQGHEGALSRWRERVPTKATMVLVVVAGVGPVLYILLTVVLGLLWEGYDPIRDTQSELGAVDSPFQLVMNVAGFGALGLSILAFAVGYAIVLSGGRLQLVAVVLLVVVGLGMVIVGFFPCDPGCVDVTATGRLHGVFSAPGAIGLPAAAIVSAWVFARDGRFSTRWQVLSLLVGVVTLASGPVIQAGVLADANGLLQRAGMWPALLWMTAVSLRLLAFSRARGEGRSAVDGGRPAVDPGGSPR